MDASPQMSMSMFPPRFKLSIFVLNVFQRPQGKGRDGNEYGGDYCLQGLSCDHLKNGESKAIQTEIGGLDAAEAAKFRGLVGKQTELPVTVYAIEGKVACSLARSVAGK